MYDHTYIRKSQIQGKAILCHKEGCFILIQMQSIKMIWPEWLLIRHPNSELHKANAFKKQTEAWTCHPQAKTTGSEKVRMQRIRKL